MITSPGAVSIGVQVLGEEGDCLESRCSHDIHQIRFVCLQ